MSNNHPTLSDAASECMALADALDYIAEHCYKPGLRTLLMHLSNSAYRTGEELGALLKSESSRKDHTP